MYDLSQPVTCNHLSQRAQNLLTKSASHVQALPSRHAELDEYGVDSFCFRFSRILLFESCVLSLGIPRQLRNWTYA